VALLRRVIGDALRARRQDQHRTLREVSNAANVSLGYLSEIERGQKEASSELLAAICEALGSQLSDVLRDASDSLARSEHTESELVTTEPAEVPVPVSEVPVPADAGAPAEGLPTALAPRYSGDQVAVSVRRDGPLRTTLHAVRHRRPTRTG
jgi:transcriptional regulator with XRE-family HTH domain